MIVGDVVPEVGKRYRFAMKTEPDLYGELRNVVDGAYLVVLTKSVVVGGYAYFRGAEMLIELRKVVAVSEVL